MVIESKSGDIETESRSRSIFEFYQAPSLVVSVVVHLIQPAHPKMPALKTKDAEVAKRTFRIWDQRLAHALAWSHEAAENQSLCRRWLRQILGEETLDIFDHVHNIGLGKFRPFPVGCIISNIGYRCNSLLL